MRNTTKLIDIMGRGEYEIGTVEVAELRLPNDNGVFDSDVDEKIENLKRNGGYPRENLFALDEDADGGPTWWPVRVAE